MPKITGHNYVKFGKHGKAYHFKPGSKSSKSRANAKMNKQRRAIEWSKHRRG